MKPVRLLCRIFLWTWWCTKRFNNIPIILILTNKNVAVIYSVTCCEQKTKDWHVQRASNINCIVVLIFDIVAFHEQCPSLTMI